ncbi:hypothetical protein [Providencia hangzhouensis]|uniref:hypothetical protein n=1 Tax=Providencia hangzhouensis TaxID=3031799 RepID=UPI0034DD7D55
MWYAKNRLHQIEQLQVLISISQTRGLFLFEAITSIHTPEFHFIKQHIDKLGEIKVIHGNYSQYSSRYNDYLQGRIHAAFDPQQAGGALYDINLYNIYLLSALMEHPIVAIIFVIKGLMELIHQGY